MMNDAGSVMTDSVVTVSPESELADVLRLFVEENIHGAPVVDGDNQLVGVVTTTDLLRAQANQRGQVWATPEDLWEAAGFSNPEGVEGMTELQARLGPRQVEEVMTKGALSVSEDTPIVEVARCLRVHQIHRVWVEKEGRLTGVISSLDLMHVVEQMGKAP